MESIFKYGIDYQSHKRKGKYYISKNAPDDIAFLYPDGRYRLSTGTPDKALANAKAQHYLRKIEDHFDASRNVLDPFIEGVRPFLESKGVSVVAWYKYGFIEHELYREQTFLWQMTGGNYESNKRKPLPYFELPTPAFDNEDQRSAWETLKTEVNAQPKKRPIDDINIPEDWGWDVYCEFFQANEFEQVAILVTLLGGYVPTHIVNSLPDVIRQAIPELTQPLKPDYAKLFSSDMPQSKLLQSVRDNVNDLPTDPVVRIEDAPPDQTRFTDIVHDYLDSKTEASKERSQRLKACEAVVRICGDRPLAA